MSAEGGHLGWRSGSLDTILKIDHVRTIHAMFALNWLTDFRGKAVLEIDQSETRIAYGVHVC
jgi:hypothetical protein